MSLRPIPLVLAALVAPMVALPAVAQTASGWADSLIKKKLVAPGDRVWLQPLELEWSAADVELMDDLTSALIARKVAVIRDLAFPGSDREPLEHLKGLGVTKVLSYTRARDESSANFRVVEVPSGLVIAVETVSGKGEPDKPTIAVAPARPVNYSRAMGLSASNLSGSGITYRRWFDNDWGYQVAGIPFVSVNNNEPSGFVNLGVQGMMPFFKGERVRLYGLLGLGAAYNRMQTTAYPSQNPDGTYPPGVVTTTERWDLGVAPGAGVDYLFYNNIGVTAAVGYTVSRQSGTQAPSWGLSPGGSFGVLVYW